MDPNEVRTFLGADTRIAVVSTTRDDGRPHAAPVLYVLDRSDSDWGFELVFLTGVLSVKGRNLHRTGQARISVAQDAYPYPSIVLDGTVATSENEDELLRWATAIGGRYLDVDQAGVFRDRNASAGEMVVRIDPTHVIATRGV
ncbi:MAG: TIGR03618 family F420-dependent PPOX class oxidoreductase [Dermatophilaceae bacterium]